MGMALPSPPTPEEAFQRLNREQRRAILGYARHRKLKPHLRDQFEALGFVKKYWDGKWDWTAFGAKVWYQANEAQTTKLVAQINARMHT